MATAEDILAVTEGPAIDGERGLLYFSDMRYGKVYISDLATRTTRVLRHDASGPNGLAVDGQGRLWICQQNAARVVRLSPDGQLTVTASAGPGTAVHSPNDICILRDGTVYFTDPSWTDTHQGAVRLIAPDGRLKTLLEDRHIPNGIETDADGKRVYVGFGGEHLVRVYERAPDGSLVNEKEFAQVKNPDGMAIDGHGRLYVAQWGLGKVQVFGPDGRSMAVIPLPERNTTNCFFHPAVPGMLYVTAGRSVYRVQVSDL